ncbi:formate dehydrogenase subunit alpha [Thalassoglobus sp. JC818]|uniref:formate dehydrogenase subunit alpha n=1 Tax=Thalassoglobus sp. JC818 TaxID=3232136 RepID=UPI00345A2991
MPSESNSAETIHLSIDGTDVAVPPGTTIWEAAKQNGIEIPILCHSERMDPVGVCRMCVVDTKSRTLAPSCMRECSDGLEVETASPRVLKHRKMLTSLLLSEYPTSEAPSEQTFPKQNLLTDLGKQYNLIDDHGGVCDSNLERLRALNSSKKNGCGPDSKPERRAVDKSSPVISVDHQACILCDRCIRACDDIQSNDVIGRTGKGFTAQISFDLNNPMGESTCVSCGECASVCPTDALLHKVNQKTTFDVELPITSVDSVCPYCGVGCAITYQKQGNQIVKADGRESPVNHSRLCVKGRYGWDYTHHADRLTTPLIRREDYYPKQGLSTDVQSSVSGKRRKPGGIILDEHVYDAFREATWDEALDLVASRLMSIKNEFGRNALAGFGSAKCSNEEAYLFQKLIRAGFQTNNVDHCTRLCHASSVAALMETIGSGAVTNIFADVQNADVCLVTGSNTTANHPVAATFIKEAVKNGTKLIIVDVRKFELAQHADHFAQIRPGSDVAFYNGVMHVLIREGWIDEEYIAEHTEDFESLKELVLENYSPEEASKVCGIAPDEIRAIARTIGKATPPGGGGSMLVFWGMGISQHTHGTDNARCLISLCLMTGNVGKPGSGLHPLRGQNNVQGASDAGLIPIVYPDYQSLSDPEVKGKFEKAWGVPLDPKPGLTVVEIMKGALDGTIRGMYILGENPFLSDPNANKVRRALANLDFLAVQDIFLTETAEFADVVFPASTFFEKTGTYTNTDRRVQLGAQVLDPPGESRQDWKIICELSRRMGLPMEYRDVSEVFEEFASLTESYKTLRHDNLSESGKLWPCPDPEMADGIQILFGDGFPTKSSRGRFVACGYEPAKELPDEEYPLVLTTGRVLQHWHTGSMTRRSLPLDTIEPEAFAVIHPEDMKRHGLQDGEQVRVSSRRGEIVLQARAQNSVEEGTIFIPFHFREASANILTNDVLDPYGRIPEFKYCAVRLDPLPVAAEA